MPGFPDWQAYAVWRSSNLLTAYHQVLSQGDNLSGVQGMSQWRSAQVRVRGDSATTGNALVTLSWYDDTNKSHNLGSDDWPVNLGTSLDVIVPAKGPYCELNIHVVSAATFTGSTQLAGTNIGMDRISYPNSENFINETGTSVAAGTNSDLVLPFVYGGLASVNFVPSDTAGKLTFIIGRYNGDGTFDDQVHNYGQPTAPVNDLIVLPDSICGIHVINTDGVSAHTFGARLTAGGTR